MEQLTRQISVIICMCFALTLFCDPRTLFRTFIPLPIFSEILAISIFAVLCALTFFMVVVSKNRKYAIFFLVFGLLSAARFYWAGTSYRVVLQFLPPFVGAAACSAYGYNPRFIRYLLVAFTMAMLLQLVAVIAPYGFIQSGIAQNSAYGVYYTERAGIFGGRASGFTIAPGFLSLYSAVGMVIGIILFINEKKPIWVVLALTCLLCGISTTNRSFVGALGLMAITVPWLTARRNGMLFSAIFFTGIFIAVAAFVFFNTEFGEKIEERFSTERLEEDLDTRLTGNAGVFEALKAFAYKPLTGSLRYEEKAGRPLVFTGEGYVYVHNGFAHLLSTRGIFFGGIYLLWTVMAVRRLYSVIKNKKALYSAVEVQYAIAFLAALIIGHGVNMVDSFLETSVMLFLLSFGLASADKEMRMKRAVAVAPSVTGYMTDRTQ